MPHSVLMSGVALNAVMMCFVAQREATVRYPWATFLRRPVRAFHEGNSCINILYT